jgi:hypothetical protein
MPVKEGPMKKFLLISALAALLPACAKATVIGTHCSHNGDCDVAGQVCVNNICTHTCLSQVGKNGCPVNFDCTQADPKSIQLTCNRIAYNTDATGKPVLFGQGCGLDDTKCQGTGDPNPMPMCRHAAYLSNSKLVPIPQDPRAYCTGTCKADTDCPINMQCLKDYDGVTKCLNRTLCSPCVITEDCGSEFPICVPDSGIGHYCTKACATNDDCGGAQGMFMQCQSGVDSLGNAGMFCKHRYGACVGMGNLCDPCRSDGDCPMSGTFCVANEATHESFCTKQCQQDTDCGGTNHTTCDNVMTDPQANPNLICTGDTQKVNIGVISCWF